MTGINFDCMELADIRTQLLQTKELLTYLFDNVECVGDRSQLNSSTEYLQRYADMIDGHILQHKIELWEIESND